MRAQQAIEERTHFSRKAAIDLRNSNFDNDYDRMYSERTPRRTPDQRGSDEISSSHVSESRSLSGQSSRGDIG